MPPPLPATRSGFLANEAKTLALGEQLGGQLTTPAVVYLCGELGAGKTTFSRGFLQARGHTGSVKSPTYTIVEPYEALPAMPVFHLDLYRLGSAEELAYLGLEDYLARDAILLIEWPERSDHTHFTLLSEIATAVVAAMVQVREAKRRAGAVRAERVA